MKVLVTGANGLLGVNLIRELVQSGVEVKAFVRPGANLKAIGGCGMRRPSGKYFYRLTTFTMRCGL